MKISFKLKYNIWVPEILLYKCLASCDSFFKNYFGDLSGVKLHTILNLLAVEGAENISVFHPSNGCNPGRRDHS